MEYVSESWLYENKRLFLWDNLSCILEKKPIHKLMSSLIALLFANNNERSAGMQISQLKNSLNIYCEPAELISRA